MENDEQPKLMFGKLKGFSYLDENKNIETNEFLNASREIVSLIDQFGRVFSPVVHDMNGNIEKLEKIYIKNCEQNKFLEEMILHDINNSNSIIGRDSLLWLKRALELIESFFQNILNDNSNDENINHHLKAAYIKTLRPYHSWIIQEAFGIIYRFIPYRSQLVGTGSINDTNMQQLEIFLGPLKMHLNRLNSFYTQHNLDSNKKV